jgi:type II secretory pathway pseudopilin PulG
LHLGHFERPAPHAPGHDDLVKKQRTHRRRERGAAAFNTLATSILIAILISTGMTYYFRVVRQAREVALRHELANIRTAIVLFVTLNRRFPDNLQELTEKECLLPDAENSVEAAQVALEKGAIFKRSYLETSCVDTQGVVLDPFGKPYRYDPRRGRVTAAETRYEQW